MSTKLCFAITAILCTATLIVPSIKARHEKMNQAVHWCSWRAYLGELREEVTVDECIDIYLERMDVETAINNGKSSNK